MIVCLTFSKYIFLGLPEPDCDAEKEKGKLDFIKRSLLNLIYFVFDFIFDFINDLPVIKERRMYLLFVLAK